LLKEAAPQITRVALVFNPETVNVGYFRPIEAASRTLSVQTLKTPVRDPLEMVRAIDAFAAEPNGGLLVVPVLPNDRNAMQPRGRADRPHCALMLAARMTLPHFSVSSAISLPKAAGEPGSAVVPKSARRAFILGSARAALIS
jgi:hypothetical protein